MSSHKAACYFADIILGGQDGLVNVLGLTLGVAAAGSPQNIIIVAGLAGMMAESISMAAVAYTSTKAAKEYEHMRANDAKMSKENIERIERILKGKVSRPAFMLVRSRLRMHLEETHQTNPNYKALSVGLSTLGGSLVPLIAYFFFPVNLAMQASIILSALALFGTGAIKAKIMNRNWIRSGLEILIAGGLAAMIGYLLGVALRVPA
jgi:VIT1/CCC1 family predicted Fe2+/Mn2+ transporter